MVLEIANPPINVTCFTGYKSIYRLILISHEMLGLRDGAIAGKHQIITLRVPSNPALLTLSVFVSFSLSYSFPPMCSCYSQICYILIPIFQVGILNFTPSGGHILQWLNPQPHLNCMWQICQPCSSLKIPSTNSTGLLQVLEQEVHCVGWACIDSANFSGMHYLSFPFK